MCDDDDVRPVPAEDILKLSGGGDWHCAYLLLYGPKVLEVDRLFLSRDVKSKKIGNARCETASSNA